MRKAIVFFMLICESFLFANGNSKTRLQIFFKAYEINGIGGEKFKVYDNDSIFYTNKIIESFKNAPKYKNSFLRKKNDSEMLAGGYFIVQFVDEDGVYFSYDIMFTDMAVRNDDKAYKYDVRKEFFEVLFYKFLLATDISERNKDTQIYYKRIFDFIDFYEFKDFLENTE